MNTKHRSEEPEIMDDFNMEGKMLKTSLDNIAWINRILGGNKPILKAIKRLYLQSHKTDIISITDIGCGNGDMLRALASMGRKESINMKLKGIDANDYTISYGKELSVPYPEIEFDCKNILDPDFKMPICDIILFTLTLHHFSDEEILILLSRANKSARLAVIINDLQRSKIPYLLFGWLSYIFNMVEMNKKDGKTSILRGFKRRELKKYAEKLQFKNYSIQWKWAFRYQWIISKL